MLASSLFLSLVLTLNPAIMDNSSHHSQELNSYKYNCQSLSSPNTYDKQMADKYPEIAQVQGTPKSLWDYFAKHPQSFVYWEISAKQKFYTPDYVIVDPSNFSKPIPLIGFSELNPKTTLFRDKASQIIKVEITYEVFQNSGYTQDVYSYKYTCFDPKTGEVFALNTYYYGTINLKSIGTRIFINKWE